MIDVGGRVGHLKNVRKAAICLALSKAGYAIERRDGSFTRIVEKSALGCGSQKIVGSTYGYKGSSAGSKQSPEAPSSRMLKR